MFIVTYPSCSEYSSVDIEQIEDAQELKEWLLNHHSDLARVKIYRATEVNLKLVLEEKTNE